MTDTTNAVEFYRLLVIEDDPIIAQNLVDQIECTNKLILVGQADTASEAISLLELLPDLVILDLGLAEGSGLDVLRAAKDDPNFSKIRFLVYSLFGDEKHVIDAMSLGASGYLLKDTTAPELMIKIDETLKGQTPLSTAAATHLLNRFRILQAISDEKSPPPPLQMVDNDDTPTESAPQNIHTLTVRETETLQLLGKGLSYKLTAQALDISTHTVADYVKQIYRKLKVNSRSEAVFEALNAGIIKL